MTGALSLADPWVRALLLPLLSSAVAVGVIRLSLGEGRGAVLANAGVGVGIVAALLAIFGLPGWPADGLVDKTFWLAAAGLALGVAIDRFSLPTTLGLILILGWPVLALLWIVEPGLGGLTGGAPLVRLGALIVGGIILFVRLDQEQDNGQSAPLMVLCAAAVLAGMAMIYGLSHSAELAGAVAAATAGYMVWNVAANRFPMGHAAILPAASTVLALAAALLVVRKGADIALLGVAAIFFANRIGDMMFRGQRRVTAFTVLAGAVPPAAFALVVAWAFA